MCSPVESMVRASSLFQQNPRIGFHGLFHLHSGGALKNTEISQKCWRPTLIWERSTRMKKKKDKMCVGEKEQHWVQGLSRVHTRFRSVHTIYSDLCIPNGHQFSNQMAISYSFHPMHTSAYPSIPCRLFTCLIVQTN